MQNIKPLGIHILVEPDAAADKTASGIIVPESAKDKNKPNTGTVLAIGDAVKMVKAKDKIIYGKFAGSTVPDGKKELLILKENDVFGIFVELNNLEM